MGAVMGKQQVIKMLHLYSNYISFDLTVRSCATFATLLSICIIRDGKQNGSWWYQY